MKVIALLSLIISYNLAAQEFTADNCLQDQNLYAEDVDVSLCPEIPSFPTSINLGNTNDSISLGAWELGTTADGQRYKYGSLSDDGTYPRRLTFYNTDVSVEVNPENLECWAKGYYRLRKILQDPPAEYVKLRAAGFQVRFFQFQTDLRNGPTGYRQISSYRDHLVKWVTVVEEDGTCVQPTLGKFEAYLKSELNRRGL